MLNFYKKNIRIGLDIDEVCANFLDGYAMKTGMKFSNVPHFNFSYELNAKLSSFGDDFWLSLPPKIDGGALPFLPVCYISTRNFSVSISERWLEANNFPCVPVYHVEGSKLEVARQQKIDVYVDDFLRNFQELNSAGIKTLLMDCTHNRQYNVDPYRISSLYEVPNKITELGW